MTLALPGETYLFEPEGSGGDHLWVVIASWVADWGDELAIIVNVTSIRPSTHALARTCELGPNDCDRHPFVKHASYVHYLEAREVECMKLPRGMRAADAQPDLLKRIQRGAHNSALTKRGFKSKIPNP